MRCWFFSGCARCSWTGEVGRARYRNPGGFACRRFMDGSELLRSGGQTNFNPTTSRYFFLQNDIHSRNISLRFFSRETASDSRFCWQLGHWPRSFVTAFTWPLSWKSISSRSRGYEYSMFIVLYPMGITVSDATDHFSWGISRETKDSVYGQPPVFPSSHQSSFFNSDFWFHFFIFLFKLFF